MVDRVKRLTDVFLATKEMEHLGRIGSGDLPRRRFELIEHLLLQTEQRWLGKPNEAGAIIPRIKALRLRIVPELLQASPGESEQLMRCDLNRLYVAQQIASYPDNYLEPPVTNTRLLETVEQLEEDIWDKARVHRPLHAIIEVCAPIIVSESRTPKGEPEPILVELENCLRSKLTELSYEAAPISTEL
jgi:hypothetical protein